MLGNPKVHPTLPVIDLERAKRFYEDKLGLEVVQEDLSPGALLQAGDGSSLYIYQRAPTKADHTVAGFEVEDVEATVRELKEKGVVFEEVDVPSLKTKESVATMATPKGEAKAAWFRDTEGNILALSNV